MIIPTFEVTICSDSNFSIVGFTLHGLSQQIVNIENAIEYIQQYPQTQPIPTPAFADCLSSKKSLDL
jgi:hypothetical protein